MTDDIRLSVEHKATSGVIYLTSFDERRAFRFAGHAIIPTKTN